MKKPTVLFVENEGHLLQDLVSGRADGMGWESLLIRDLTAATEILRQRTVAVVVIHCASDSENCKHFLTHVKDAELMVIRLEMVSAKKQMIGSLSYAHLSIAAHCEPAELLSAIGRALEVWNRLQENPNLGPLLSELHNLPSPPALYFSLRDELESPSGTIRSVAAILARDTALSARILRMSNSGFFARPRQITDLHEAVGLLGLDLVLGIVLSAHLFDRLPLPGLKLDELWKHNFAVAGVARHITKMEGGDRECINAAGLAGLLHDLGSLVLLANLPNRYQGLILRAETDEGALFRLESQELGVTHPEIGAMVLKLWNLPDQVVNAIATHHGLDENSFRQADTVSKALFLAEQLVMEYASQGRTTHQQNGDMPSGYALEQKWRDTCRPLLEAALIS